MSINASLLLYMVDGVYNMVRLTYKRGSKGGHANSIKRLPDYAGWMARWDVMEAEKSQVSVIICCV
jgi:hypothetical protein